MKLIMADELKAKIDRGDDFKLVMALGDWAFALKHIPGSLNIHSEDKARELLGAGDEIVVYCSNPSCIASVSAYKQLKALGYEKVSRFAGGLQEWEERGWPLEGSGVEAPAPAA